MSQLCEESMRNGDPLFLWQVRTQATARLGYCARDYQITTTQLLQMVLRLLQKSTALWWNEHHKRNHSVDPEHGTYSTKKNKKGGGFPQEQCVCVCVWSSCGGAAGWNVINYAGGTLTYIVFRSLRWWLMGDGAAAAASDEFFPLKNSLWHANSSSF